MRGKFETTLKMHQMCFVHATPEEFKSQQSLVILDLCWEENSGIM